jgi:hypothetical protein
MPLSFFMSEHFEGAASIMPRQLCANLERQRSHECERGTQECVRHNGFNTLPGAYLPSTENASSTLPGFPPTNP